MGIALATTLFSVLLAAAVLSGSQAESTRSWSAAPASFMSAIDYTVHIVNGFGPPALLLSALRGQRRD